MASTDILSQTLASITAIKLDQLQKQKDAYEGKKSSVLADAGSEADTIKRIRKLLKGTEELGSFGLPKGTRLTGLDAVLDQAEYDPSVSPQLLGDYEEHIRVHLASQSNKYEFASLYGKLVEEWVASGTPKDAAATAGAAPAGDGREEMHQQRATWEAYIFQAKETDGAAIRAYLDDVFESKEAQRALATVRDSLKDYQKKWKSQRHFNDETLETCIRGMLRSDILTEEKRKTLRDFVGNKVVLAEIADVLNMRMSTIASWTWGAPLIVEQRRNLNGRYRFHTDEDLLHSIFVYYVGLRWALELRQVLQRFIGADGVWKSDSKPVSRDDARRHRFFLNQKTTTHAESVQKDRDNHFRGILLDQLPDEFDEVRGTYGDDADTDDDTRSGHVQVVQDLLQRLQTEIVLATKRGREMTVIRSDFKWFGPSIPHSTIFAVLDFLGVDAEWTGFFQRVLGATMRFKNDAPDTPSQVRKRGTPVSTPLADYFSESILFCLDFAVNQKAAGTRLYRLHDDMWIWGSAEKCAAAWEVVTGFTDTMGLELNQDKTGSAQITPGNGAAAPSARPHRLPDGNVTWGFLALDPGTGRFLIDQREVDKHIGELRIQLAACRSVLDYVQAWNIYGNRFFANNLGRPANCYGRGHLDSMLTTFRRIQAALFPDQPGGIGAQVKALIARRLAVPESDIPDGCLWWPTAMGGLGLQNPFITALLARRQVAASAEKLVDDYLAEEQFEHVRAQRRYEEGLAGEDGGGDGAAAGPSRSWRDADEFRDLRNAPFMPLEEFVRHRERTSPALGRVYRELMLVPAAAPVVSSSDLQMAVPKHGVWDGLSYYEQWVVWLYHKDMVVHFGGLEAFDEGLLPTGLMTMLRESRFQWQG
ncbi:hypothetical protein BT67DRAFT_447329 [Trichocladium antarcticum]|uniref:Reverse transcriptase domain-containing protein n=1 Tax=Trichocladium antarcticum TaxID=1450529 RepID=A0AAN6ZGH0_9PEZI|nr:hypothetical protein BT67DRAFT_447329 [Trichocladium antarcticum]